MVAIILYLRISIYSFLTILIFRLAMFRILCFKQVMVNELRRSIQTVAVE